MNPDIYFTPTVGQCDNVGVADSIAIICVRLSLRHVLEVPNDGELMVGAHDHQPHLPQTLKSISSGKIKVRFPGQIENWVIVLHMSDNEGFDPSYYDGFV
ncbi:unnamed protein product [Rotaria sp. Silwood2]|nr:unnamed protein product [Rotaria sp. Silwood2]CAF3013495.1 unnamed protein product [Rotaria sp. Silwood2]CAF3092930.1 unnamed protein product [Rotaria sp. Silwood2]CAF3365337.1 unnamed protein product [Rotaria sp. Silwood2]CAF3906611.1 unnamed protein product [Rotaria sp. Silwood2]